MEAAIDRADAAMAEKDWGKAMALWREVLDQFGERAPQEAHLRLSLALRRDGNIAAAQAVLLERLKRDPEDLQLRRELAALVEAGEERPRLRRLPLVPSPLLAASKAEWEQVASLWKEVLRSASTPTPEMANGLAGALCQLGHFREADEVLERALAAGIGRGELQSVFDSEVLRTEFLGRFGPLASGAVERRENRNEWYRLGVGARRLRHASGLNAAVTAPSAISGSGEGRWGNSFRQLVNALEVAESLDVPRVYLPPTWYLDGDDPIDFRGHTVIQSDTTSSEERLVLRGRFLSGQALDTILLETESPFRRLAELRPFTVFRDREPLGEDDLVIHIRAGDVFRKGSVNANYGQPPLAYYLMVLRLRRWRSVHLVYEDDRNPVIEPLLAHLRAEGIDHTTVVTDLKSTIEFLLTASTIVAGKGHFIPTIAGLSSNLRRLYSFEGMSMVSFALLMQPTGDRPRRFDRWESPPGVAQIDVIDDRGDYRRALMSRNWENRPDQIQLMLDYPESALRSSHANRREEGGIKDQPGIRKG
jgi:tetratricopeptide (TPR) repeat protein